MTRLLKALLGIGFRSAFAWTALFLAPELAAHYKLNRWQAALCIYAAATLVVLLWPIVTFSATVWDGEAFWPVVMPAFIAVFTVVLVACHFELHWSAKWVVAGGVFGALLIVSRLLEKAIK